MRLCALEDTELLAEEQDLNVLVIVRLDNEHDEVKQHRPDMRQEIKDHTSSNCRGCAEQRSRSETS